MKIQTPEEYDHIVQAYLDRPRSKPVPRNGLKVVQGGKRRASARPRSRQVSSVVVYPTTVPGPSVTLPDYGRWGSLYA